MQQRDTSGNITSPPSASESGPQGMAENEIGEGSSHAHTTYYRQQKKRSKPTYEEYLLEVIKEKSREDIDEEKSFLMSLVPSFKKLNDEQKFVAKVEFLNVMRRITLCQPPYHVSSPPQLQSYSIQPGPSGQHQHNPYSESTVHSTLLLPTAVPPLHIRRSWMETVCHL